MKYVTLFVATFAVLSTIACKKNNPIARKGVNYTSKMGGVRTWLTVDTRSTYHGGVVTDTTDTLTESIELSISNDTAIVFESRLYVFSRYSTADKAYIFDGSMGYRSCRIYYFPNNDSMYMYLDLSAASTDQHFVKRHTL